MPNFGHRSDYNLFWDQFSPSDAAELDLSKRLDIYAPLNEMGERCPWPWEPQQLVGVPMGQYHCNYCGGMVLAGVPHTDWRDLDGKGDLVGGSMFRLSDLDREPADPVGPSWTDDL